MASDSDNFKYRQSRGWTKPFVLMRNRASMDEQRAAVETACKKTFDRTETKRTLRAVGSLLESVVQNSHGLPGISDADQCQQELQNQLRLIRAAHAGDALTPLICESAERAVSQWAEAGQPFNESPQGFFVKDLDEKVKHHQCYAPMKGKVCEETGMSPSEYDLRTEHVIRESAKVTQSFLHQAMAPKEQARAVERRIDHSVVGLHAVTLSQP
jgi:hypothetical protein